MVTGVFSTYCMSCLVFECSFHCRLILQASQYYDLANFPECEAKRQLLKLQSKLKARMMAQ